MSSCSTCARRSTAAGPKPTSRDTSPGAIHSDYDKAGWRVTRGDVPLMLPTVPNWKNSSANRHRGGQPRRRRSGRRQRHGFRLGGAHLLDAEVSRRAGAFDPRRRLRRLDGRPDNPVETGMKRPHRKSSLPKSTKRSWRRRRMSKRSTGHGGATLSIRAAPPFSPARNRRRRPPPMGIFLVPSMSTMPRSTTRRPTVSTRKPNWPSWSTKWLRTSPP